MPADNSDLEGKLSIREEALLTVGGGQLAQVLDCYAGEGHMYRQVWHKADRYLGLEKRFARPAGHTDGECWRGDNARMLDRALRRAPWNIVDLDAYGSPWQLFRRVARAAKSPKITVTMTCGLQRNLCGGMVTPWVRAVTGANGLSYTGLLVRWYDDVVRWTIEHCLKGTGFKVARARRRLSRRNKDTWYWLVELARE